MTSFISKNDSFSDLNYCITCFYISIVNNNLYSKLTLSLEY